MTFSCHILTTASAQTTPPASWAPALVLGLLLVGPALGQEDPTSPGPLRNAQEPEAEETASEGGVFEEEPGEEIPDLMSLNTLFEVEVETVSIASRKDEKLRQVAAAVAVLTAEDIRRLGAETIPDALRGVPGFNVSQVNRSQWSVSARGSFGGIFENKLLVLQDGRNTYSPIFAGTYWNSVDYVLADIDRIEVIRGPGGTIWGANAVQGIVNILTKHARDTQGFYLKAATGTEARYDTAFRYGDALGDETWFRVYGKLFDRDGFASLDGGEAHGDWHAGRLGVHFDGDLEDGAAWHFQSAYFGGEIEEENLLFSPMSPSGTVIDRESDLQGGHALARYEAPLGEGSDLTVQGYYDRLRQRGEALGSVQNTVEVEAQHDLRLSPRWELSWGGSHRIVWDRVDGDAALRFTERTKTIQTTSLFAQGSYEAVEDTLWLTAGAKLTHDTIAGINVQPSLRAAWTIDPVHAVWAAVSRAVRTPSRSELALDASAGFVPPAGPFPGGELRVFGNDDFTTEKVHTAELGWRFKPSDAFALDVATYASHYRDLQTTITGSPVPHPGGTAPLLIPILFENDIRGHQVGGELAINWQATPSWNLGANYSLNVGNFEGTAAGADDDELLEGSYPEHQVHLRSRWDITEQWELNGALHYASPRRALDLGDQLRLDLQVVWEPDENTRITVGGRNLLDDLTAEYANTSLFPESQYERNAYIALELRF